MALVRTWFADHPPSAWIRFLELSLRALNWVLLMLGLAVAVWSVVTVVQIQHEPSSGPSPPPSPPLPPSPPPPSLLHDPAAAGARWGGSAAAGKTQWEGSLKNVPWFIYAFGALGLATAFTASTALLGIRLRSPGCMSSHIFFMCLLLTGQACAAVAFFIDRAWQQRLPDIDEKLKEFLAARLQVCKWLGVGLLFLQLLELLLGCGLQGVYVGAEEAAEDADEEAAWRRRPLLHQQQAARQATNSTAAAAAAAAGAASDPDGWRERMQQQYGLDTSQFTYRPGADGAAGAGAGGRGGQGERGRGCSIM